MDYFNFDRGYFRSNTVCCDLVVKTKQYANVIQVESSRISALQLECNQLLDKFYASKVEFELLIDEELPIKYLAEDDSSLTEDYIKEFSTFAKNIWQVGKHRFSEKGKKTQYMCFVGSPLTEVMATIQSFVDELMIRLVYMPYHGECTSTMHSICSQIYAELQGDCLSTADACLRQFVYLQAAVPFLHELKGLIQQYLLLPEVHTPKQFVDTVILHIPSTDSCSSAQDSEDMKPFRYVVDLLNGSLLDTDVLDHNSDIRPIVEDDINLKRSMIVIKTVEWISQQYNAPDLPQCLKYPVSPLITPILSPLVERKKTYYSEMNAFRSPRSPQIHRLSHQSPVDQFGMVDNFDLHRIEWSGVSSSLLFPQRKPSRKGRRSGPCTPEARMSDELQPINLHTLQTPMLPPLL